MKKIYYKKNYLTIKDNDKTISCLKYEENEYIRIAEITSEIDLDMLINKLVALTYYKELNYIYFGNIDLTKYHFEKTGECFLLDWKKIHIRRFLKVGEGKTGKKNNICDCPGVEVSHFTINEEEYNTGLTIISPHQGNIFREKVIGASYAFNGFGKSIGLVQIDELGTIETNIVLTSTMNAPKIADAVISHSLEINPEIGISTGTVNPVVLECNDGSLNNSRNRILGRLSYKKALEELKDDMVQGSVGAGTGMVCHGFKGGIGSSSRIINIGEREYTIAVLVNSNFGESNGKALYFNGHYLGDKIKNYLEEIEDKGSIIVCFATDLPLNERQIRRVLKRCEIGIGRTGSYAGNGSGDVFVGFSTANKIEHFSKNAISQCERISDNNINIVFKRTVECVEEAILNSLLFGKHTKGFLKEIKALGEVNEVFYEFLDEEIEYEI